MPPKRALIVDDEPLVRRILRDMLEDAEYTVAEARDGTEGLEKAETLRPDLILLDLMMPGVDGYTVCKGLKANPVTQAIPVVFVTASADRALNRQAYAAGAIACLPKPFRPGPVVAVIEAALASIKRRSARAEDAPKRQHA